jgi:hypothetical protein
MIAQSINVIHRVIDIKFACRRDNLVTLNDFLQLTCFIVDNNYRRFLFLAAPDGEPHLVTFVVVLRLDPAWGSEATREQLMLNFLQDPETNAWRKHYNDVRPHSSLGYLSPTQSAKQAA